MAIITDILEDVRWVEENGRVVEISRGVVVSELDDTGTSGYTGDLAYDDKINHALYILNNEDFDPPNLDYQLKPGAGHPVHPVLKLRKRIPRALTTDTAFVECVYARTVNETAVGPNSVNFRISGGTIVQQISTAFENQELTTQLLFTVDGETVPAIMQVNQARRFLRFEWEWQSATPGVLTDDHVNKINSAPWQNGEIGTWYCSSIVFESIDTTSSPPLWRYTADFEYDPEGHQPKVWPVMPDTGQPPPAGSVTGGIPRVVTWYGVQDFRTVFP